MAVAQASPPRPRASGGRLFIVIGAVLALLGFAAAVLLGNLGGNKAGSGAGGPTHLVVYAAKNIDYRTQIIDKAQIEVKAIPVTAVGADMVTIEDGTPDKDQLDKGFKAVQNLIAEVGIAMGSPLLHGDLAKQGDIIPGVQAAFLPIPQGYVAFTMPTSEQQGVAGYIQNGDYISVIASMGAQKTAATVTIFPNLRVLRVGAANLTVQASNTNNNANANQNAAQASANSITVVVTPCQAEQLIWFQTNATLKYELESYKDYQPAPTGPDAACAGVGNARGVQESDIIAKFPQFQKALGG